VLKIDLAGAIEIIQSILQQANASIAREERDDALHDLNERVEDWKSLRIDSFGELMLFGTFSVLKGEGGSKDQEKEVGCPPPQKRLAYSLPRKANTFRLVSKSWNTDVKCFSTTSIFFNVYFYAARI
jgi:hypothetical protein